MADAAIKVHEDPNGTAVDNESVTTVVGSVMRQRVAIPAAATSVAKAEDAAAADADVGIPPLAVRQDSLAPTTSSTGDYQFLAVDAQGRLWVNVDSGVTPGLLRLQNLLLLQQLQVARAGPAGFVPIETPDFLIGG